MSEDAAIDAERERIAQRIEALSAAEFMDGSVSAEAGRAYARAARIARTSQ